MTSGEWDGPASRRAGRSRAAFRAARRHTVLVHILRRAIPIGAGLAVLGLVITPFLNPLRGLSGLSVGSVGVVGGKVKMETPRLSGYRKDNRPYEVVADSALQDIRNPTQVELVQMTARIDVEREGRITVEAKSGLFDTQKEKLRLVDDIKMHTQTGYTVRMRTADIDFKAGTVVSREPVKVNLGTTTVDADTLDVKDNGALIVFSGRVRAVIENAPANTLAGPERVGSVPAPEILAPPAAAGEPAPIGGGSPVGAPPTGTRR